MAERFEPGSSRHRKGLIETSGEVLAKLLSHPVFHHCSALGRPDELLPVTADTTVAEVAGKDLYNVRPILPESHFKAAAGQDHPAAGCGQ